MLLSEVLKNTNYDDTMFSDEAKADIESHIFTKNTRGMNTPYVLCLVRKREIKLTPEEAVRQLYIYKLIHEYHYPANRIQL